MSPRHSSFTQFAPGLPRFPNSSRASRAWRIASSALKQPAVFGRIVSFDRSRLSRRLLPAASNRRSRRTATVVTSHPLATMQRCISSWPAYFPVPVNSRLVNVNVPTLSGLSAGGPDPPPTRVTISTASPSASRRAGWSARGTTSRFTSTASFPGSLPSARSRSATVVGSGNVRGSSLTVTVGIGVTLANRGYGSAYHLQLATSRYPTSPSGASPFLVAPRVAPPGKIGHPRSPRASANPASSCSRVRAGCGPFSDRRRALRRWRDCSSPDDFISAVRCRQNSSVRYRRWRFHESTASASVPVIPSNGGRIPNSEYVQ